MVRSISLVVSLVLSLILAPSSALASEQKPVVVAAHNGSHQVAGLSDGSLVWRKSGESTWRAASQQLSKNGVSNVYWNGKHFVATSFFGLAWSSDGKKWNESLVPAGRAFDPAHIITDSDFFKSGSMSESAVQRFLDSKASPCLPGFVCLKDYSEATFSRVATPMCKSYQSSGREKAARIIAKVSEACGVSAEVLLVLLQKEQSLITHSSPTLSRYQRATGYACPDTAPCDSQYFGFYNQVYHAAKQFKRYANPPGTSRFFTWYPVGKSSNLRLHPNTACGTTPVTIRNQATAGLYYYTPYTPNASSLQSFSGLGDSCSSYGNRNFWRLYNVWFNRTKDFSTWYVHSGSTHLVVDREGSVAMSNSNLSSWRTGTRVPGAAQHGIRQVGYTPGGAIAIIRGDRAVFTSADGVNWVRALNGTAVTQAESTLGVHNGVLLAAPEAPKSLAVTVTGDVLASWSSDSQAKSYTVYLLDRRGKTLGRSNVIDAAEGEVQSVALSEIGLGEYLKSGSRYRVAVSATNDFGEGSRATSRQSIFTVSAPAAPTAVQVTNDNEMAVSWATPKTLGGSPVIGYRVYLLNPKGKVMGVSEVSEMSGPDGQLALLQDLSFYSALKSDARYRIAVTAVTRFGESKRPATKKTTSFVFTAPVVVPPEVEAPEEIIPEESDAPESSDTG